MIFCPDDDLPPRPALEGRPRSGPRASPTGPSWAGSPGFRSSRARRSVSSSTATGRGKRTRAPAARVRPGLPHAPRALRGARCRAGRPLRSPTRHRETRRGTNLPLRVSARILTPNPRTAKCGTRTRNRKSPRAALPYDFPGIMRFSHPFPDHPRVSAEVELYTIFGIYYDTLGASCGGEGLLVRKHPKDRGSSHRSPALGVGGHEPLGNT